MSSAEKSPLADRVSRLAAMYADPNVSAAEVLCDAHPADALAYRVVDADLNAVDITYGQLRTESEKFAAALSSLGVQPGDRVATLMSKTPEYLTTLMGIWRLGAVHVPIFTAFAPGGIALRLKGSSAKVVVCDAVQQEKLLPSEEIPADAPWQVVTTAAEGETIPGAVRFADLMKDWKPGFPAARLGGEHPIIQIFTSGTTGKPKGLWVPTKALAGFRAYAEFGLGLRPDDLYWCAADPGWAYGLYFGILGSFTTGVPSLILTPSFDARKTFEVLASFNVTNFTAAPTVYRAMRAYEGETPKITKLRCASSAGEPLTSEVNLWAKDALGVFVHDHYGQTEAGMLLNNHHHPDLVAPLKTGSMGKPLPGWSMLVLKDNEDAPAADGELGRVAVEVADSPLAWFRGYIEDPQKSAEKFAGNGRWYLTGDAGRRDEDGYYHFASRDDDVIIMAGYRIGPFEIETVIATHPAVNECAVIAVPDSARGEVLEAYVVLRDGEKRGPEMAKDIQQWVKSRYAAHAYPRQVHFTNSLPRTPSGKVQRFVLRQMRRDELLASAS